MVSCTMSCSASHRNPISYISFCLHVTPEVTCFRFEVKNRTLRGACAVDLAVFVTS